MKNLSSCNHANLPTGDDSGVSKLPDIIGSNSQYTKDSVSFEESKDAIDSSTMAKQTGHEILQCCPGLEAAVLTPERRRSNLELNFDENPSSSKFYNDFSSSSTTRECLDDGELLTREITVDNRRSKQLYTLPSFLTATESEANHKIAFDDGKTGASVSDLSEQSSTERPTRSYNPFRTDSQVTSGNSDEKKEEAIVSQPYDFPGLSESSNNYIAQILQSNSFSSQPSEESTTTYASSNHSYEELRHQLKKIRAKYSDEKQKRRKGESWVVKLAKELKRKQNEADLKRQQVTELAETIVQLETKLNELDIEKLKSDHLKEMTMAQKQYSKVCRQHDAEIKSIQEKNKAEVSMIQTKMKQREEALKKSHKLELKELRQEIQALEKARNRAKAQMVAVKGQVPTTAKIETRWIRSTMFIFVTMVLLGFTLVPMTREYSCTPLRPGTRLTLESKAGSYDAPWFVPYNSKIEKSSVFSAFCGSRKRSRITWLPNKSKGRSELHLSELDDGSSHTLWKRTSVVSVEPQAGVMKIVYKSGKIEDIPFPI